MLGVEAELFVSIDDSGVVRATVSKHSYSFFKLQISKCFLDEPRRINSSNVNVLTSYVWRLALTYYFILSPNEFHMFHRCVHEINENIEARSKNILKYFFKAIV